MAITSNTATAHKQGIRVPAQQRAVNLFKGLDFRHTYQPSVGPVPQVIGDSFRPVAMGPSRQT